MEARFDIVVNLYWRVFQFTLAVLFANILIYLIIFPKDESLKS